MRRSNWVAPPSHVFLLLPILALGAILRFTHLTTRGYIYWDEGKFALEGIRLKAAVATLFGGGTLEAGGKAIGTAKPTHALLIALADTVFGVHDYSSLIVNALCGVGAVYLTYLLARRLFDTTSALVAALLLAVSEYDVIYARSGLSESDATVFLLAGMLLWWRSKGRPGIPVSKGGRNCFLGACLCSVSFTVNYRMIVYVVTAIVFDSLWTYKTNARMLAKRVLLWLAGLSMAPLCWQVADLITRAHGFVLFRSEVTYKPISYFREVIYQLHQGRQSAIQFHPLPYLHWYLLREGLPVFVLLLVGSVLTLRKRSPSWLLPASLVWAPYLAYVFAPFDVARNLAQTIPFISVLTAATLVTLARTTSAAPYRLAVAAVLISALGVWSSWRLTSHRSGFAQAAGRVQRERMVLVTNEIMTFYLRGSGPRCNAPRVPRSIESLKADVNAGSRYAVVDRSNRLPARLIARTMQQKVAYPVVGGAGVGENLIASESPERADRNDPNDFVRIYRLVSAKIPVLPAAHPDRCDPEHV